VEALENSLVAPIDRGHDKKGRRGREL